MGQNSSRGKEQIDIEINHPKFTQSKLLHHLDKALVKTVVSCDQKSYKTWKQLLSKYKQVDNQYLLLATNHKYKSSGVCATRGQLQIEYESYPYLLTDEIYNRKGKKVPFTQPQLWYLLYACFSAKNYLSSHAQYPQILLGDIRPQNIFINEKGQVKFSNLLSWPNEKINYKKTFDGVITYLSPEDYESLQLGQMSNQKNSRSEYFSIGFTLVAAAILKDNSDCYNVQKQKFDGYEAKKRVNAFKSSTIYSELIRAIIASLCEFQPKKRVDENDVWMWITKYQRRIMTKQPFMIDQVPPKINQHINLLRADLLTINPQNSILTVKSLRGSQQKSEINSVKSTDNLLISKKQANFQDNQQAKVNQIEFDKRRSRIVFNTGVQQKVFLSPNNGGYFRSQVNSSSQLQSFQSPPHISNNQSPSNYNFQSPRSSNYTFQAHKVMKSPQGFYSPRNSSISNGVNGQSANNAQKFRVFIQYKSPIKPIEKPFAQTTYLSKDGSDNKIVKVEAMEGGEIFVKKQSDSKSQKSGGSDRHNRFVEETKRQNEKQQQVRKIADERQKKPYKKQSPINQIISSQQILQQTLSEVVSQDILMPSHQQPPMNHQTQILIEDSMELPRHLKQLSIQEVVTEEVIMERPEKITIQKKSQKQPDVSPPRQQNDERNNQNFQIDFSFKNSNDQKGQSDQFQDVKVVKVGGLMIQSPQNLQRDITKQYADNLTGLSIVHRDSHKKNEIHDSKLKQEQRSHYQSLKKITQSLKKHEQDQERHLHQEQLNEQTFVQGRQSRVPPKTGSSQSISMKFQIPQRHINRKPNITAEQLQAQISSAPSYDEVISQIVSVTRSHIKKPEPLSFSQKEQQERVQKIVEKALGELIQYDNPASDIPNDLHAEFVVDNPDVQSLQPENNLPQTSKRSNSNVGEQVSSQKQVSSHQQLVTFHANHISAQEIIVNEISSQKQPEGESIQVYESDYAEDRYNKAEYQQMADEREDNHRQNNDDRNILIVEEQTNKIAVNDPKNQVDAQQQQQQVRSSGYELIKGSDRPLISLGPQIHHEIVTEQQNQVIQQLQSGYVEKNNQANSLQGSHPQPIIIEQPLAQKITETKKPQSPFAIIQNLQSGRQQEPSNQIIIQPQSVTIHQQSSKLSENLTPQLHAGHNIGHSYQNHQFVSTLIRQTHDIKSSTNHHHENDFQTSNQNHENNHLENHHDISHNHNDTITYNVIEVNDTSLPQENNLIKKDSSDIAGSGKMHSRYIDNQEELVIEQTQSVEKILTPDIETIIENFDLRQDENHETTIYHHVVQGGQLVVVEPIQHVKEQIMHDQQYNHRQFVQGPIQNENQNDQRHIINSHHSIPRNQDPFLQDIIETNHKLAQLQESQKAQQQQPLIIHDIDQVGMHFIQSRESATPINLQSYPKKQLPTSPQQDIHNSQIQFDVVKEVVGIGKDIREIYEVKIEPEHTIPDNQDNSMTEVLLNNKDPIQQFMNPQATLSPAPLQSEFGNISQIMDINRQFNNSLNAKQMNLSYGTSDPKSQEFLKQLINMSQQGKVHKEDIQKIQISSQDKEKLANFMELMNSRHNQHQNEQYNIQQAIHEFRSTISPNFNRPQQKVKLHLSTQDKHTLQSVVNNLNNANNQNAYHYLLQPINSNDKQLVDYDQSNVQIKYSEMRTQNIDGNKKSEHNVKELPTNSHDKRSKEDRDEEQKRHIVDEIILLNQQIKYYKGETHSQKLDQQQKQKNTIIDQAAHQFASFFVSDSTFTDNQKHHNAFNRPINLQIDNVSRERKIDTSNYELDSPAQQHQRRKIQPSGNNTLNDIVDQVIQLNEEYQQLKGSQVNASVGEKSEREDPLANQEHGSDKQYNSLNQHIDNTEQTYTPTNVIKYHCTHSQPNNLMESISSSVQNNTSNSHVHITNNFITGNIIENSSAIVEELNAQHEHEQDHANLQDKNTDDNHQDEESIVNTTFVESLSQVVDKITEGLAFGSRGSAQQQQILNFQRGYSQRGYGKNDKMGYGGNNQEQPQYQEQYQEEPIHQQDYQSQQKIIRSQQSEQHVAQHHSEQTVAQPLTVRRSTRPRDFLDDVMEVNTEINHDESKDYYKNNKFLNADPIIVQIERQAQIEEQKQQE